MNELRKMLALFLALVMIFSLGMTALAAEEPPADSSAQEESYPSEDTEETDSWAVTEDSGEGTASDVSEAAEPGAMESEAAEPEAMEPEAAEPETAESEPEEPEAAESEAEEPEAAESEAEEPEAAESEAEEPEAAESGSLAAEVPASEDEPDAIMAEAEETEVDALDAMMAEEKDAEPKPWVTPGNSDSEILGGGRFLRSGSTLYYIDGGLWMDAYGGTSLLSYEAGGNLNLVDGWLYYTVGSGDVYRIPEGGGSAEWVYSFGARIKQLYVIGSELRFLAGGAVYSYDMESDVLTQLESPDGVMGLIPTEFGNLYLTGEIRNYDLWAGTNWVLSGVELCYTDGAWLVVVTGGETFQAYIEDIFAYGSCDLQGYSLHTDYADSGLSEAQQLQSEADFLESSEYELMQDGLSLDGAYTATNPNIVSTGTMNSDQKNIVQRARQMAEVQWTPLMWRYSWGGDNSSYNSNNRGANVVSVNGTATVGYFQGGETYQGIPYSQAVNTGFVGWDLSIDEFIQAVNDTSSKFYSGYSHYSRTAPYYGTDCSGFVSWAWDLPHRCTCTTILEYCYPIENNIQNLQIGDCINEPSSHVVLVTNIGYDADGYVNAIEITEQTPCKVRVTCYGELFPGKEYDHTGSLSYFQQYYFNYGYRIYRRNYSGNVSFEESKAITLHESGYASAPLIALSVNSAGTAKIVTLTHTNSSAVIYYTTDGSAPTKKSTRYTGPFEIKKDTVVKAIADCGSPYTGSYALTYSVSVSKAAKPYVALLSGALQGGYVSSGTKITVTNKDKDKIYYTTDGSTPTKKSDLMPEEGLTIKEDMTFKAVAVSETNLNSDVVELTVKVGTFHTVKVKEASGGSIKPSGNAQVLDGTDATFEIKADEFFRISDVLVDGKSVGAVTSYTIKKVKEDHTITAVFVVALPFTDVTNQWFAESVNFVYSKGLFSGTSADKFSPNAKMTRGMFITVLGRFIGDGQWRDLENWSGTLGITNGSQISIREKTSTGDESLVLGLTGSAGQHVRVLSRVPKGVDGGQWYKINCNDAEGYVRETLPGDSGKTLLYVYTGTFKDLPNGAYYTGYAEWAYIYGIMNGVSDTKFSPNSYITRQDICVLFYRYLINYTGKKLSTEAAAFTDEADVASYALDAVHAMKNIGVLSGYSDGSVHPRGYATRAEVATMFERLYTWMYG